MVVWKYIATCAFKSLYAKAIKHVQPPEYQFWQQQRCISLGRKIFNELLFYSGWKYGITKISFYVLILFFRVLELFESYTVSLFQKSSCCWHLCSEMPIVIKTSLPNTFHILFILTSVPYSVNFQLTEFSQTAAHFPWRDLSCGIGCRGSLALGAIWSLCSWSICDLFYEFPSCPIFHQAKKRTMEL